MSEKWLPIVGYEGFYEVSDCGRVRSVTRTLSNGHKWRGRVRKTHNNPSGYPSVNLSRDGKYKTKNIHRMVLEAFCGPAPMGMDCCHNDGNPENNMLKNLRWASRSENAMDRVSHGTANRGENHGMTKLCKLDVWLIRNCNTTQRNMANFFGVSESTIHNVITGKTWMHQ